MTTIRTDPLSPERLATQGDDFIGADQARLQATLSGIRDDLDAQRRAGRTLYYCGTSGDDAGKLFMHTPEGRRFEYRTLPDGSREIVRELLP